MATTTAPSVGDRIESWFSKEYDDIRGFFFGHESTSTTSASASATEPVSLVSPTSRVSETATATGSYVNTAPSAVPAVTSIVPEATSVIPKLTTSPVAVDAPEASSYLDGLAATFTSFPAETSASSVSAIPSPSASAAASHSAVNVNTQTFLFAALGAGMVLVVYLLTPVIVRLAQFSLNATKLIFQRTRGTFSHDSEMGLTSDTFSLTGNIERGDARQGLDKKAKLRVMWYMLYYGESFDEARFRYVLLKFTENGIGPDGQPLDPKFMSYEQSSQ